jgi:hypothetical protein
MWLKCAGCGAVSEDGYKPCDCITMVGLNGDKSSTFLDPAKRDALARIVCRHLTGKDVSMDGSYDNWLCPMDDESANTMCAEIADEIVRSGSLQ